MDIRLSFLITWPDREALQRTMPFCFRPNYGLKVTSIIDCFELFIEKPSDLFAKSCIAVPHFTQNQDDFFLRVCLPFNFQHPTTGEVLVAL